MDKEVIMRSKAVSLFAMLVIAGSLANNTADAQSVGEITFDIPFEFNVAGNTHPAGEYLIALRPSRIDAGLLLIRSARGDDSVFFWTNDAPADSISSLSKLVFNRYGDGHFLTQIRTRGENMW